MNVNGDDIKFTFKWDSLQLAALRFPTKFHTTR